MLPRQVLVSCNGQGRNNVLGVSRLRAAYSDAVLTCPDGANTL
jgi:hypothetical protein